MILLQLSQQRTSDLRTETQMLHSRKAITFAILLGTVLATLVGCGKAVEPFNDATVGGQNKSEAEVGNMPDGFSNFATKCDHGNRVYVIFHGNSPYGSIAVVPNDPSCAGAQ